MITIQDIQSVPDWETKTPEEVLAYLTTVEPKRLPNSRYSERGLKDRFGVERVAGWAVAIEQTAKTLDSQGQALLAEIHRSNWRLLHTESGVDFANEKTVVFLDSLESRGIISAQDALDLKSLGYDFRTPWQRRRGNEPVPVLAQIEESHSRAVLRDWTARNHTEVMRRIDAGQIISREGVSAYFRDVE